MRGGHRLPNKAMPEILLHGCAPLPLAHYLKALGIFRLVSEQADSACAAYWRDDVFVLDTLLSEDELLNFFLNEYRPTPVLAPWNGGSGFFPKDNSKALDAIEQGQADRLTAYRAGIAASREALKSLSLSEKPDKDAKTNLLQACRNELPENALNWLDAALVLSEDGPKFPPLLGTGGNDGRLEFTNNFMQRIGAVMDPADGQALSPSAPWLRAALFAEAAPGLATSAPIGQFFPGAAGGANASAGFDSPSTVNPWDYILMLEGALLFAAASVKRLESLDDGALVYPFCVRQVGVGYASAAGADENDARCEMWMPLWTKSVQLPELQTIFSEGRAQVRGRPASNGVDFAQAVVTLGVDRGISAFQRYGFQVRNGLAYFATPLDRVIVRRNEKADLLADFDHWRDRLRQKAGPRANPEPPASVGRALRQLEQGILALCQDNSAQRLQSLLATLGRTERALAHSFRWSKDSAFLQPLGGLRPEWLKQIGDTCREFRLAASLASLRAYLGKETIYLRQHLEPVHRKRSFFAWDEQPGNDVVWREGDLTGSLLAILQRRMLRAQQSGKPGWPDSTPLFSKDSEYRNFAANLDDIAAFIAGEVDETLLADLLWGLCAIDWEKLWRDKKDAKAPAEIEAEEVTAETELGSPPPPPPSSSDNQPERIAPSAFYALLRCCFRFAKDERDAIPLNPAIVLRAASGNGVAASQLAARRLRGSGLAPLADELPISGDLARRSAAALLFPVDPWDFYQLERTILKPKEALA